MATRKPAAKAAKKTAAKTAHKSPGKPPAKAAGRGSKTTTGPGPSADPQSGAIRVRMYRVGFGDFFLMTVPGKNGPAHILIDCGVHAANINTIDDCVQDMKQETGNHLALVILTHYHADHMSGFASNYDDFAEFDVGAVWITNRLDPHNTDAHGLLKHIKSVALQLKMQLATRLDDPKFKARQDDRSIEANCKVENALGVASEGGSNAKALRLLQFGFKNKPPVYYYQGGDRPTLPDELKGMITAEILGPSPKDSAGEFAASDNKTEQYLSALADNGVPDARKIEPFDTGRWPSGAGDYPPHTFDEFDSGLVGPERKPHGDGAEQLKNKLAKMQPDVLAATADKLDGTLNNQSLVVLFTCNGKKLLFVGDAQWGNWAYWLYGKAVSGADPGILDRAKEILGSLDFYKVGHHGSTNATPIPAVAALKEGSAAMCSTATGAYGNPKKNTEVPRTALMEALESRSRNRMVRSDWIPAGEEPADAQAKKQLPDLPEGFTTGALYVDYAL